MIQLDRKLIAEARAMAGAKVHKVCTAIALYVNEYDLTMMGRGRIDRAQEYERKLRVFVATGEIDVG
jgi:hypothetical protein